MDKATQERLLAEIGLGDPHWIENRLNDAVRGTPWERVAQTNQSVFFNLFKVLFRDVYRKFLFALRALLPQLFIRTASGRWLEEHAADHGMTRHLGRKARWALTFTKESHQPFSVQTGDRFFAGEFDPLVFLAVNDSEFGAETQGEILVEAEAIGQRYNVLRGSINRSEVAYPLEDLAHPAEPLVYGADRESDAGLRGRLLAVRRSGDIQLGTEPYYLYLLKTVPLVVHATLDAVSAHAVMTFSVYGEGGLSAETVREAQALLDGKKMATDRCVVRAAEATPLALRVQLAGSYGEAEVRAIVVAFFQKMGRGDDFESSLLAHDLYEQIPTLIRIRVTPQTAALEHGGFFIPQPTFDDFAGDDE